MRILIDIGHPAHVHFFKNVIKIMGAKHAIFVTAREKDVTQFLLKIYNIDYVSRGKGSNTRLGKFLYMFKTDYFLVKLCIKLKISLVIGINNHYIAQSARLLNIPSIIFNDTENVKMAKIFTHPFASNIVVPSCYLDNGKSKFLRYNGYHELAYLHPQYYSSNKSVLQELGIDENEKYVIVRFVAWKASHDFGHKGISPQNKISIVKTLSKYAKVFVSAEGQIPDQLKEHQLTISPEKIHAVLHFASLLYGESTSMASECAMLGTPAIYVNEIEAGVLQEQERYGLIKGFGESPQDLETSLKTAVELLITPNLNEEWQKRRQKMLSEKIDVTAFVVWFIENYPKSVRIMKKDPDYQYQFK